MQRTQPWLGTLVTVAIHGSTAKAAPRLFDRVFAAIECVHGLMSFHDPTSDVSRMNRDAWRSPIRIHRQTFDVLRLARRISTASEGVFDVTIAPLLVASGFLPAPDGAPRPDPAASWRDISLRSDGRVQFRKPLWIDLGGIAKGYAVDAGLGAAHHPAGTSLSINAGGDLRVAGPQRAQARLVVAARTAGDPPPVILANQALASSQGVPVRRRQHKRWISPHWHGRTHRSVSPTRFVSVIAPRCAIADALTKVVLAQGRAAAPLLTRFAAHALVHDGAQGWQRIGVRS